MSMPKDYYNILGIKKDASGPEIKAAYKNLAKKYHPDVSTEHNAEEKFKEVQEAYSVLSDPTKRGNYDNFGGAAGRFSEFGGFGSSDFSHFEFDFGDLFGDLGREAFSGMFNEGFREKRGPVRGKDIISRMNISFKEAAFGATRAVEVERAEECGSCKGSGSRKGSAKANCETCKGTGMQRSVSRTIIGTIATAHTCTRCNGSGKVIKDPCNECNGTGTAKAKRKIEVRIPAGVNTGNNLRMKGEGNSGEAGASAGDLYVVLFVEPHEIFRRDGADIFVEMPLSFSEAALGTDIMVPTLDGNASLKIPSGTQTGTVFRMNGKGIKVLGKNEHGSQFVKVFVKTPSKLNSKEKELFKELSKHDDVSGGRRGFFDKLKGHFS